MAVLWKLLGLMFEEEVQSPSGNIFPLTFNHYYHSLLIIANYSCCLFDVLERHQLSQLNSRQREPNCYFNSLFFPAIILSGITKALQKPLLSSLSDTVDTTHSPPAAVASASAAPWPSS